MEEDSDQVQKSIGVKPEDVVAHTCHLRIWEVEAGGEGTQGHPLLPNVGFEEIPSERKKKKKRKQGLECLEVALPVFKRCPRSQQPLLLFKSEIMCEFLELLCCCEMLDFVFF